MIVLPPTALTRMSIAPNSCATETTSASTWVALSTSVRRPCARRAQCGNGRVESIVVIIDGDHDRSLARHDVGGSAADPARRRGNDRDLVGEAHGFLHFYRYPCRGRPSPRRGSLSPARGIERGVMALGFNRRAWLG